jgi:thiosulfate/3-mercaptopyruvate sulfurtransferase
MTTTDPLVTTEWLAARLGHATLRLVDGSFKMPGVTPTAEDDYRAAHLPGAVFFDVNAVADRSNPLPHMMPTADQFARDAGALGIGNDDTVICYDSGNFVGAPRVWWMFRTFGHRDVFVLDGGMKKWLAEGRPVTSAITRIEPRVYRAGFDAARVRHRADLVVNVVSRAEQVVDARSRERFEGAVAESWPGRRSGRIPGSLNVPYPLLCDADTGMFRSREELARIFAEASVDLDRPVVTTCGSGITAAAITLALARLGCDAGALYDGSWADWGLPDGPDIATGPV